MWDNGDSTFIITPKRQTILIDGGGSEFSDFDVGKQTLLPYILDRGYAHLDKIIISHTDSDHIGGVLRVIEEIPTKEIYISEQKENSKNYKKLVEIAKEKNIKLKYVKKGDKINIENNLCFDVLWPEKREQQISMNPLNNNSIVCSLNYKKFKMLFTGDIEEIAEKKILEEYKNNINVLNSAILKVGHHGSKSSSIADFLEKVNPKIALIGVGKNNNFGHPNIGVVERLEKLRS